MKRIVGLFIFASLIMACKNEKVANEEITSEKSVVMEEAVEIDLHLTEIDQIPVECEYDGHVVDAYTWKDLKGTNYIIRTITDYMEGENIYSEDLPSKSQYLYAYHYIERDENKIILSRKITDFVKNCEFDLNMSHLPDGITLTDLDEDDIGEVSLMYRLTCTSDVSPPTQKLLMLENGDKYPLRGTAEAMGYGGEYTVGKEFEKAPDRFLEHAKELWKEHQVAY